MASCRRAIWPSRTFTLSISRMSTLSSLASLYLLTPTITSLPLSMRACFSAAAASILSLAQPVHGLGHAAHGLDLFDDLPGGIRHVLVSFSIM